MIWAGCVAIVGWAASRTWRARAAGQPLLGWASLAAAGAVGALLTWPSLIVLQKGIATLLMPTGLLWLGLIAVCAKAAERSQRIALGFLLLAYTLLGNGWVGSRAVAALEHPYRAIEPLAASAPFDAVMVLGGGTSLTPTGKPQLGPSGDRVRLGAALYHAGLTPLLLSSGSGIEGLSGGRDLAEETRQLWLQMGVPDAAIRKVNGPRNTSEEIQHLARILEEEEWDRVGLVTSAWHLRRAMRLAARAELDLVPLPADLRGIRSSASFVSLIPQSKGFSETFRVAWEVLGMLAGR